MMKQKTTTYPAPNPHASCPSVEGDSEPALPALPPLDQARPGKSSRLEENPHLVRITVPHVTLEGSLEITEGAVGLVLFAHGSGSGRRSPRNRYVAHILRQGGLGTLLIDLLTPEEEVIDMQTAHLRFDIPLLAERLMGATDWLTHHSSTQHLRIGYFGASTGSGASLMAAAERPDIVQAVVSRGGRPDLAGPALARVRAPVLLIVGGEDFPVIELNREAMTKLRGVKKLEIVPGATHLFEEPGTLEEVSQLARGWFQRYLRKDRDRTNAGCSQV
jgi:putative phosphoribosyl transferase